MELVNALENRSVFEWLLAQGVNLNETDRMEWSLCHSPEELESSYSNHNFTCRILNYAASKGDIELFEYLVSLGADPNRSIALHEAARCDDYTKGLPIMVLLLDKYGFGIDADDRCNGLGGYQGMTNVEGSALTWAIAGDYTQAVEFLLSRGGKLSTVYDSDGIAGGKAIHNAVMAQRHGVVADNTSLLHLILECGADPTCGLLTAIYSRTRSDYHTIEAARVCLERGADVRVAIEFYEDRMKACWITSAEVLEDNPDYVQEETPSARMKELLDGWLLNHECL